jgi:hypothetical protein
MSPSRMALVDEVERLRDALDAANERIANFERHVEREIEPKLLARAEKAEAERDRLAEELRVREQSQIPVIPLKKAEADALSFRNLLVDTAAERAPSSSLRASTRLRTSDQAIKRLRADLQAAFDAEKREAARAEAAEAERDALRLSESNLAAHVVVCQAERDQLAAELAALKGKQ